MKQFYKAFTLFLLSLSQGTTPALAGTSSDGGIGRSDNVIVCHEVIAASLSSTPPVTRAAASDNLGDANRNDKLRKRSIYSDNEKEDSSEQEEIRYFCVIKESKEGTRLELLNVPPSFKDDMERNVQLGKKHLVITKSTLELPVSTTNFGTFGEIAVDPSNVRKLSAEEETRMGGVALGSWEWKYPSPKNRSFKPRKTMEMDADTCSDDPSFEFTIDIGNKVGCQWLRQREDKIATRVDRYCSRTHVRFACPKSCLEDEGLPCACPSDVDEFTFDLDVAGTEQECSWLTRNSENTLDRQQRYCYDDENTEAASDDVGESCITSCGFCRGYFPLLTSPPSNEPTLSPTTAPTLTPSSSPTECVDEPDWKTHQLGFTCAEIQELVLEGPEFDYCVKFSNAESQGKSIYEACCVCGGSAFQTRFPSIMPSVSLNPTMSPSGEPSSSPSNDPSSAPSLAPSDSPSMTPSSSPSDTPTMTPSDEPSSAPSRSPSDSPTKSPSSSPSDTPTMTPSDDPSSAPSLAPSDSPSMTPSSSPSDTPTMTPSDGPSSAPSRSPSDSPTKSPSSSPSDTPTMTPSDDPSSAPSRSPSDSPTKSPSSSPSDTPTMTPSDDPSSAPSLAPSDSPSMTPSSSPSDTPTMTPSDEPSSAPSLAPSDSPTKSPSSSPSDTPTMTPSDDPSNAPSRSPSDSPTKSPSSSPSNTPTVSPSLLPSNHPTINCSDDPNFTFVLDNGEVQFCEWLTRNEEKSDTRIDNYCSRGHVKGACQKSCSFCECADDDEHTFPLQNLDASRGCSWLTQSSDPFVNEDRLDRYCYADLAKTVASEDVGDFCVFSCGFCKGNYRTPPEFLS